MLSSKQIQSVLRNKDVKNDLLANGSFQEEQLINFITLSDVELKTLIQILEDGHAFYSKTVLSYPPQWETYPDPIQIKALEGVYGVYIEDEKEVNFFDAEDEAISYADSRISDFYDEDGEAED